MSEPPTPPKNGVAIGDRIDVFQIVELVGATATSMVWRAHDELMDRDVAIKQFRTGPSADDTLRQRWHNEGEMMKQVADGGTHLVQFIDWIQEDRGCFLVMEFIDGPSLDALLTQREGPLEPQQAIGILGATALALAALHQRNMVHRDLKPSNILLPRAGGLKVCDFGLSALQAGQETMSAGTVRYMAPELFGGGQADPRSDVYALGMIGYEMLVGRKGFEQAFRGVLRDPRTEALRWVKWHTNRRHRAPAVTTMSPNVPATLNDLIHRMMEKDPHRRVPTAQACVEAIRRHFSSGPPSHNDGRRVVTTQATQQDQPTAELPRRRRPVLLPVLLAILAIQILAAAAGIAFFRHHDRAKETAKIQAANADLQAAVALVEAQNYHAARAKFARIQTTETADAGLARTAAAYLQYCNAMQHWEAKEHGQALEILDAVDRQGLLPDRDGLMATRDQIVREMGFTSLKQQIEAMRDNGRFVEAIAQIDRDNTMRLSNDERTQLRTLRTEIQRRRTLQQLDDIEQEVEFNLAKSDHDAALNLITRIRDRGGSEMPQLTKLEERVRQDRAFVDFRHQADAKWSAAAKTHDPTAVVDAIKLLEQAGALRASAGTEADHRGIQSRLAKWRGELAYRKGRTAETEGKYETAQRHFRQAAAASHLHATAAVQRVTARMKQRTMVAEAQRAMQQRRYADAVEKLREAVALADDAAARNLLESATVNMHLQNARRFESHDDIDHASAEYRMALEIDQVNEHAHEGLARVAIRAEYLTEVAAGNNLFAGGRFAEAKRRYLRARQITATAEIEEKLDATEFEDLMGKARQAMDGQDYREARALLHAAADTTTGQVKRERERIEKLSEELNRVAPEEQASEDTDE